MFKCVIYSVLLVFGVVRMVLKRPGTAILYFFFIMILFIVKESCGYGLCNKACFGPVWKVKILNELSNGFLHVEGNTVMANFTKNAALYKISQQNSLSFYLYDANAARFICWNNRKSHQRLVARKYRPASMGSCLFTDDVSDDDFFRSSHVNLVSFSKDRMRFNKHGRFVKRPCEREERKRKRHFHVEKCLAASAAFLTIPVEKEYAEGGDSCSCPEAREYFCRNCVE